MHSIAESNVLLRARAALPKGLKLATKEFQEGWNLARSVNARRLGSKVQARGWSFIDIPEAAIASGVGDTSEEAIAGALRLGLRRITEHSNVVEFKHVELIQYPWFFIARVGVWPYRIQHEAEVQTTAADVPPALPKRPSRPSATYYPLAASALPMLKEMHIFSRSTPATAP